MPSQPGGHAPRSLRSLKSRVSSYAANTRLTPSNMCCVPLAPRLVNTNSNLFFKCLVRMYSDSVSPGRVCVVWKDGGVGEERGEGNAEGKGGGGPYSLAGSLQTMNERAPEARPWVA